MRHILAIFVFVVSSMTLLANDTIVGGLSSKSVSINTTFTGSNILIFGSIKRSNNEKIIPSNVIIEIIGPKTNITVRKKKKIFGIWVNSNPNKISDSPSFYSLLFTEKPENILSDSELTKSSIGKRKFFKSNIQDPSYTDAINAKIRIRSEEGSYIFDNDPITLKDETLFSTKVSLPSNLIEGDYKIKIYLVQDKKLINLSTDVIEVRRVGLERWLHKIAHEQSLFYGMFSIFLALFFGWGASTLFRRFQK